MKNEIIDKLGRKILLKEMTGRTRLAFYRALGPKDSINGAVVMEYWNVMFIDEIDGRKQASIKGLVDLDFLYGEMDKGQFSPLIDEWVAEMDKEKLEIEEMEKEEKNSIKKD